MSARTLNDWGRGDRNISGCGLAGILNTRGHRFDGEAIIRAMSVLHDRGNGLGGGYAAYGIYPDYADDYAFHVMYYTPESKDATERIIAERFDVTANEPIPTRPIEEITDPPLLWRYFVQPNRRALTDSQRAEADFVIDTVMEVNVAVEGAYVFSSGKNMGAFKAVGFAEDVGRFYRLEDYRGYLWIGHGRFPTNTPGWWAGAHPFTLLDWSVVHNGEISSYGINKRYLEQYGYRCTMRTDTEVMAYLLDLLIRRHQLPVELACHILAPPFWKDIDAMPDQERELWTRLRQIYGSAMVNGPFAIVFANAQGMVGLNDRVKLRPLVAAKAADEYFIASEEAAIREVRSDLEEVWSPRGGEPVIATLEAGVLSNAPGARPAAV
jgi:glutamate synthase domain-containing protein 1